MRHYIGAKLVANGRLLLVSAKAQPSARAGSRCFHEAWMRMVVVLLSFAVVCCMCNVVIIVPMNRGVVMMVFVFMERAMMTTIVYMHRVVIGTVCMMMVVVAVMVMRIMLVMMKVSRDRLEGNERRYDPGDLKKAEDVS